MIDEGYIKFNCHWIKGKAPRLREVNEMNRVRTELHEKKLIGVYEDGVGFGNISVRAKGKAKFIVSGTQTGQIPVLNENHYAFVLDYDLSENSLTCEGRVKASSESLTHAALYDLSPDIGAIIHIHHPDFWRKLLNRIPTTKKEVPYGTPEMALEMKRLYQESDLPEKKILVMAGHEEGILAFGSYFSEARRVLFETIGNLQ